MRAQLGSLAHFEDLGGRWEALKEHRVFEDRPILSGEDLCRGPEYVQPLHSALDHLNHGVYWKGPAPGASEDTCTHFTGQARSTSIKESLGSTATATMQGEDLQMANCAPVSESVNPGFSVGVDLPCHAHSSDD